MNKGIVGTAAGLAMCAAAGMMDVASAQDTQIQAQAPAPAAASAPAAPTAPEKETWKAPFGGSFTATIGAILLEFICPCA